LLDGDKTEMKFIIKIFRIIIIFISINHLQAQDYEIKFDSLTASGWFGGDNHPDNIRNVASAQSILIKEAINLESFSFYFTTYFDSAMNASGSGHEVHLKLHIRDSLGTILKTEETVVPDTFTGGWVTWSGINLIINTPGKYIFSSYLVGGYDSVRVFTGQGCDLNSNYADGELYVKYITNDAGAEFWGDWSSHFWDANFWLKGSVIPTDVNDDAVLPDQFVLHQNYPNPFNPSTKIRFSIPAVETGHALSLQSVTLKVYNILGNEVAELVNEYKSPGVYEIEFDGSFLSSGVYVYRLEAGSKKTSKKFILMK